jgi:hypothetical protein
MKLHVVLVALVALGFFASQTDLQAHGGGGFGGGGGGGGGHGFGGWGGGGGRNFRTGGWGARGRFNGRFGRGFYYRGRFFYGPGFGFYGYPWWPWWWDYYGYYGYYPGPYYGYGDNGGYYASSDPPNNSNGYQFNSTRAVQAALAWRGFYNGRIDGVMGSETRSAIRAFQRQQGLPETGEIDSNLTKALQGNR